MKFIERNNNRGFGQPVIVNRRLTVLDAIFNAKISVSINTFLSDFDLKIEELKSAVEYCEARRCKEMTNKTDKYCNGCILRSVADGWKSIKDDFWEKDGIFISKDDQTIILSSLEEADEDEFGIMGWVIAEEVHAKIIDADL
ncbi:Uncharacterized conserved protein, DUF433 family [Chitinophaga costaii]|uniref:Uncharacterized conserved protein, DUF433 family n=1 Tax=Chitinophaga costaii TaxID=1335309 RepID=A0A1C4DMC5_9BACT|nr:DUF433 domain-containing protein [Chitinophaga costaii]PUZ27699.1 DUF433 domain-containing protein [Chitinophaga costaii]SCC32543.1 Uncharacterized conserved protein, DUF433 family [Chitinophaga costaii]